MLPVFLLSLFNPAMRHQKTRFRVSVL